MKNKFKYAVITGDTIRLTNDPHPFSPAWDTVIENPRLKFKLSGLELKGQMWEYGFTLFGNDINIEDVQEKYTYTKKRFIWWGKKIKCMDEGWVRLKKTTPYVLISSKYDIVYEDER